MAEYQARTQPDRRQIAMSDRIRRAHEELEGTRVVQVREAFGRLCIELAHDGFDDVTCRIYVDATTIWFR